MSSFRRLVGLLRRDALAAPAHLFEAARSRQAAFAGCADLAAVLATLADECEHTYPERETLTRALLTEHRATHNTLWASALVAAYYPMLSRLRKRLISASMAPDELDQVVLTAFLATLADLAPRELADRVAMRLRQRTQRQVFAHLRKERERELCTTRFDEETHTSELSEPAHRAGRSDAELIDLSLLLKRAVDQGVPERSLDIVVATVLRRELLRSYVDRIAPGDELERERMYQRLKRQRSRALRRLRTLVAESPLPLASGS